MGDIGPYEYDYQCNSDETSSNISSGRDCNKDN